MHDLSLAGRSLIELLRLDIKFETALYNSMIRNESGTKCNLIATYTVAYRLDIRSTKHDALACGSLLLFKLPLMVTIYLARSF